MVTIPFLPHPLLRSCIQAYVYVTPDSEGDTRTFDLFPIGYTPLIFSLDEHAFFQDVQSRVVYNSRFHFVGQLTRYRRMQITRSAELCIVFKPTGAFRLFGTDQSSLVNDSFAVSKHTHAGSEQIVQMLAEAGQNVNRMIQILESWFLQLWHRNDRLHTAQIDEACRIITSRSGKVSIGALCREIGMSKSSLEAHFKAKTGIGPKMYSRIIRFNSAYRQIKMCSSVDWQEVAFRHNYFDQSHFIHEFKAFYGYSPSAIHTSFHNLAAVIKEGAEQHFLPR